MDGARERAPAEELDRIRALLGKRGKGLYHVLVQIRSGRVPGPAVYGHVGKRELVSQREAAQHRQATEQRMYALLDDCLSPVAVLLAQTILGGFH